MHRQKHVNDDIIGYNVLVIHFLFLIILCILANNFSFVFGGGVGDEKRHGGAQ